MQDKTRIYNMLLRWDTPIDMHTVRLWFTFLIRYTDIWGDTKANYRGQSSKYKHSRTIPNYMKYIRTVQNGSVVTSYSSCLPPGWISEGHWGHRSRDKIVRLRRELGLPQQGLGPFTSTLTQGERRLRVLAKFLPVPSRPLGKHSATTFGIA